MRIRAYGLAALACRIGLLVGLVVMGAGHVNATASMGACCQSSGGCVSVDAFSCSEAGGTFLGDGTSCADAPCGASAAVPVFSLFGLVGVAGALGGLGLFRLIQRSRQSATRSA
jgi:hypothetical protein